MKKFLAATAILFALSAPTLAADFPAKAGPMVAAPAVFNWTGLYLGGNFGSLWGKEKGSLPVGPLPFNATLHQPA